MYGLGTEVHGQISFTIDRDVSKPIHVYYYLDNFYQVRVSPLVSASEPPRVHQLRQLQAAQRRSPQGQTHPPARCV